MKQMHFFFFIKGNETGVLQELMIEYIELFGSRPVCFSDIKKYLKAIPVQERNDFILK